MSNMSDIHADEREGGQVIPLHRDVRALLPQQWSELTFGERMRALVDHPRGRELVPALPADELFHLIRSTGMDVALELLPYVSAEQWQAFVDIDGWADAQVSLDRFRGWVAAADAAGEDTVDRLLDAIDEEYLVALLQTVVRVHEKDLDTGSISDESDLFQSPDGDFWLEMPHGHGDLAFVRQSLETIFATDLVRARRLLRASIWELPSSLEQDALRFRAARLADLGYPSWDDAMERLYTPIAVKAFRDELDAVLATAPPVAPHRVGAAMAFALARGEGEWKAPPLLVDAMARVETPSARDAIAEGFAGLAHAWVVAHKLDIAEWDDHVLALERVYGLVHIGLATLSRGEVERAAAILERVLLTDVYRAGQSLVTRLLERARAVAVRVGGVGGLSLFGLPTADSLALALAFPASAFGGVGEEGAPIAVAFSTREQLRELRSRIDYAEAVLDYFDTTMGLAAAGGIMAAWNALDVPGLSEDERLLVRFDTLFLTALAHRLLDGAWSLEPLTPQRIPAIADALLLPAQEGEGRLLRPEVERMLALQSTRAAEAGDTRSPHVEAFVRGALHRLQETLGYLAPDEAPDPRFLGELFLVASPLAALDAEADIEALGDEE